MQDLQDGNLNPHSKHFTLHEGMTEHVQQPMFKPQHLGYLFFEMPQTISTYYRQITCQSSSLI